MLTGEPANYHFTSDDSLAAHAERRGVDAAQAFVDISHETRGTAIFSFPFLNQQDDAVEWMLGHDYCALGLGDSGAHVGLIMDAGQPTWLLADWVRDRQVMTLEEAVRRLTSDTADLFGVRGRGRLTEGAFADVNVIDLDALRAATADRAARLPARCEPLRAAGVGLRRDRRQRCGVHGARRAHRRIDGRDAAELSVAFWRR